MLFGLAGSISCYFFHSDTGHHGAKANKNLVKRDKVILTSTKIGLMLSTQGNITCWKPGHTMYFSWTF